MKNCFSIFINEDLQKNFDILIRSEDILYYPFYAFITLTNQQFEITFILFIPLCIKLISNDKGNYFPITCSKYTRSLAPDSTSLRLSGFELRYKTHWDVSIAFPPYLLLTFPLTCYKVTYSVSTFISLNKLLWNQSTSNSSHFLRNV